MTKIPLAGMTCLSCGKGRYDGYQPHPIKKTLPCEICGDIRPSSMTSKEFIEFVRIRDIGLKEAQVGREDEDT
jgi:hypothetical protein